MGPAELARRQRLQHFVSTTSKNILNGPACPNGFFKNGNKQPANVGPILDCKVLCVKCLKERIYPGYLERPEYKVCEKCRGDNV